MTVRSQVTARLESTAFSCEALQVRELRGREAISEPFEFAVDVDVPGDVAFDAKATLGADVTIVLELDTLEVRRIHGVVGGSVDLLDTLGPATRHQLRIVPRLHRLSLSFACEVFLERSVVDITRELLARASLGAEDARMHLLQTPAPEDFVLQYAESNLSFVSRRLERAGIAYSFDHSNGRDVLVLSDDNEAFRPAVGPASMRYIGRLDDRGVTDLSVCSEMMTARHVVHDHDADHPRLDLRVEHTLDVPFGGEIIDFCAGHATPVEGQRLARLRAEARQAAHDGFEGASNLPHVEAGRTVAIDELPALPPGRLLVVWAEHHLVQSTMMHSPDAPSYTNRFRAVPASRHYAPLHRTPWPRISGFVHAVTDAEPPGASGRIAQLDTEGRYTVRFLFDRARRQAGLPNSARVRMVQPHAGPGYGMHFPLKPGVEVLVAFIEGDPDRPIIVGSVPNPLTASPVTHANVRMNRIETESGITITMKDA